MKRIFLLCVVAFSFLSHSASAGPGDYTLRVKGGPLFNLDDWFNQVRLAGEFDYDFGYSMGFNLMAGFGISDEFRFDLIPSARFDYLLMGPAAMYATLGMGYTALNQQSGLGLRIGTGLSLPLGDYFEFNTSADTFVVPAGTPGTPWTFEWLIGFGFRFH